MRVIDADELMERVLPELTYDHDQIEAMVSQSETLDYQAMEEFVDWAAMNIFHPDFTTNYITFAKRAKALITRMGKEPPMDLIRNSLSSMQLEIDRYREFR